MAPLPSFPSRLCICFFNAKFRRYMAYRYHIFLSFRGTDVRRGFSDHLYHALTNAGFRAFLDTYSLNRGDDISATLHNAIEESPHPHAHILHQLCTIALVSQRSLTYCTPSSASEAGNGSSIAVPLFYDVTPAQVRRPDQSGSPFAEAFKEHEMSGRYSPQEIHEWKDALVQFCRLSGWSLPEDFNGYEAALVKRVVEDVAKHCMTDCRSWPSI